MKKLLLIPYVFTTLNWAVIVGLVYFLRNEPGVWRRPAASLAPRGRRPEQWV